jgi:hypothetical protein
MKNININKRLALKTETLRSLADQQLRQVGGGAFNESAVCTDPTNCCGTESCPTHVGARCRPLQ